MTRKRPDTFGTDPLETVADVQPRTVRRETDMSGAVKAAAETGFTPRSGREVDSKPSKGIDARSLRKSNKTAQLGIKVSPETKDRFWRFAMENGYTAGEDVLVALLNGYAK